MLFQPVPAVEAQRPQSGLVASALTPPTDDLRWRGGMSWRPERCPSARAFDASCGIESPFAAAFGAGEGGLAYYVPPAFRVEDECFTRVGGVDEARARRQAEAVTSYMIARELQDGAITRANPFDTPDATNQTNAYLASSLAVVEPGTWEAHAGLGRIEELARQDALGQDVYIHMPVRYVPLMQNNLVMRGNLLYTQTGARVVADPGYTGTGALNAGTPEVQTVTITGAPTGGTFTLTYNGFTTTPLAFNASAGTVQNALTALPNIDTGEVTVTGANGGPYTVTFLAELGNVAQMTASGAGLTGGTTPAVAVATTTQGVAPAPAAGNWLYATGPVEIRLDDLVVNVIDRWRENRQLVTVDRLFAATFDPCNLHALAITVPATT